MFGHRVGGGGEARVNFYVTGQVPNRIRLKTKQQQQQQQKRKLFFYTPPVNPLIIHEHLWLTANCFGIHFCGHQIMIFT